MSRESPDFSDSILTCGVNRPVMQNFYSPTSLSRGIFMHIPCLNIRFVLNQSIHFINNDVTSAWCKMHEFFLLIFHWWRFVSKLFREIINKISKNRIELLSFCKFLELSFGSPQFFRTFPHSPAYPTTAREWCGISSESGATVDPPSPSWQSLPFTSW